MANGRTMARSSMRPVVGQESMMLPVTFDYSGGRKDKMKSAKLWSVILAVLCLIIMLGLIIGHKSGFLFSLVQAAIVFLVISTIIRFPLLKEHKLRKDKQELIATDGVLDTKAIWGIYDIDDHYPYICRFRSGKSGVFIGLNKDVILGKSVNSEFDHYEAIGDAYNISCSSNIQICHVDYMDIIGSDERLDSSFLSLAEVSNPDLKDLLTGMYTYQQEQMSKQVTTFDVYVFLWSGSDDAAWLTIQRILSCFMEANYRSYHVLSKADLVAFPKTVFLLEEFSAENSMLQAFTTETSRGIVPIKVVHSDNSEEKLGKTREEIQKELELQQSKQELTKEELKRRKKSGKSSKISSDEEIDLFN